MAEIEGSQEPQPQPQVLKEIPGDACTFELDGLKLSSNKLSLLDLVMFAKLILADKDFTNYILICKLGYKINQITVAGEGDSEDSPTYT